MNTRLGAWPRCLVVLLTLVEVGTPVSPAFAEELNLPADRSTNVLWTDGHDLVVIGDQNVHVLDAQGETRSDGTFVRASVEADGTGVGENAIVVVVGREGEVARFQRGVWHLDVIPVDLDSELVGVEVAPGGAAYIAESAGIVHCWEDDSWRRFSLPEEGVEIRDFVLTDTSDQLFTVDSRGQVFQLSGDQFSRLDTAGGRQDDASVARAVWYDRIRRVLWVLYHDGALVGHSPEIGEVTSWTTPIPHPRLLTGLETSDGALLLVAGRESIVLFDGEQFYSVGERFSFAAHLHPVAASGVVYVVGNDRTTQFELNHPFLGTGSADPVAPPGPPREIFGGLRLGLGHTWHQRETDRDDTSLSIDVDIYGSIDLTPGQWRWAVRTEVGYHFDNHDELGGHFFSLGMGPTLHSDALSLGYSAALLAGNRRGSSEVGMTHGPRFEVLYDIFGVEVTHRALGEGEGRHAISARFTIEIIRFGALVFGVDRPITIQVP